MKLTINTYFAFNELNNAQNVITCNQWPISLIKALVTARGLDNWPMQLLDFNKMEFFSKIIHT